MADTEVAQTNATETTTGPDLSTPLAAKLKKQISFYFSDSNYPKDNFLRTTAEKDDGWIPLSVIATFSRMKQMSSDLELISAVARTVEDAIVNEAGDKIKRKHPLPEKDTVNERSLYVKGLPSTSTIESVGALFTEGEVLSVRLLRNKQKKFYGKAFIEFKEEAQRDAYLVEGAVKIGETALHTEKKVDYQLRKTKEREEREAEKQNDKKRAREEQERIAEKFRFKPNLLLKITNVPEQTDREAEAFSSFGKIDYIDLFQRSENICIVRFAKEEESAAALEKLGELKLGDVVLAGERLSGEEEQKYWKEKITPFANRKPAFKKRKRD